MEYFFNRKEQKKIAVKDFNLTISKGDIVGLLGPNGAGKTTLMKMFTGIIVPSSGQLKVLGHIPHQRSIELRMKMSLVMGQKSQLWWDIPAMDSFNLLQKYYKLPKAAFDKRIEEMGTILDVTKLFHVLVRKLSLGERMKMEVMACLLHNPEIIFLDEPTIGLDIIAQDNIRQFILHYHQQYNPTIIITSHYMADVHALCKRIVLIQDGQKRFDGALQTFETLLGDEVNLTLDIDRANGQPFNDYQDLLSPFDPQWVNEHQVNLRLPKEQWQNIAQNIMSQIPLRGIQTEKLPIERVMKILIKNPKLDITSQQL